MQDLLLKNLAPNERLEKLVFRHHAPEDFSALTGKSRQDLPASHVFSHPRPVLQDRKKAHQLLQSWCEQEVWSPGVETQILDDAFALLFNES